MYFKQISVDGLGCLSYVIACSGEAAIVDPKRDIQEYLDLARDHDFKIKYIIDTHLHADHISGNTALHAATGGEMCLPAWARAAFPHRPLHEGDILEVGRVRLQTWHTPGHTPEHISLLVADTSRAPEPWMVLTGDTLFVGDVGRPDLLGKTENELLAEKLYDSTRRLLGLADAVEVYPGHGMGSLCGRAMSAKLSSTIGFERRFNPALAHEERQDFVAAALEGLPPQPPHVNRMKQLNREGPPVTGSQTLVAISPTRVWDSIFDKVVVLDCRDPQDFGRGHIPGAINVPLSTDQFANYAGWVLPPDQPILLLMAEDSAAHRAAQSLMRIGVDSVLGYIIGGMAEWQGMELPVATLSQVEPQKLAVGLQTDAGMALLDVRTREEWQESHVPGAVHIPLGELADRLGTLERGKSWTVICGGGYRSSAAGSLLLREGFPQVTNVQGGIDAWKRANLPVSGTL